MCGVALWWRLHTCWRNLGRWAPDVLGRTEMGMNSHTLQVCQGQARLTSPVLDWGICSIDSLGPPLGDDVWHGGDRPGKGSNGELIFNRQSHLCSKWKQKKQTELSSGVLWKCKAAGWKQFTWILQGTGHFFRSPSAFLLSWNASFSPLCVQPVLYPSPGRTMCFLNYRYPCPSAKNVSGWGFLNCILQKKQQQKNYAFTL